MQTRALAANGIGVDHTTRTIVQRCGCLHPGGRRSESGNPAVGVPLGNLGLSIAESPGDCDPSVPEREGQSGWQAGKRSKMSVPPVPANPLSLSKTGI